VVVAVVMVTAAASPREGSFKQQHELDKNNLRYSDTDSLR
jgi:hypothetical protein